MCSVVVTRGRVEFECPMLYETMSPMNGGCPFFWEEGASLLRRGRKTYVTYCVRQGSAGW